MSKLMIMYVNLIGCACGNFWWNVEATIMPFFCSFQGLNFGIADEFSSYYCWMNDSHAELHLQ